MFSLPTAILLDQHLLNDVNYCLLNFGHILWLYDGMHVLFKYPGAIILKFSAFEDGQDLLLIWGILQ